MASRPPAVLLWVKTVLYIGLFKIGIASIVLIGHKIFVQLNRIYYHDFERLKVEVKLIKKHNIWLSRRSQSSLDRTDGRFTKAREMPLSLIIIRRPRDHTSFLLHLLTWLFTVFWSQKHMWKENWQNTNTNLDYSIVRIKIKSRKRAGDISGRADTGIWHGIYRKYVFLSFPRL